MLPVEAFAQMQLDFIWAFGWLLRWWLILFAVAGFGMAVVIFFLMMISNWLDSR